METRKRKNIIIGVLCSLLVFMGIGYAVLSQVLTINAGGKIKGNWNIYIESIEPYNIAGHAKSLESKIGMDKLSASIEAELNQPNDYVDYKVVVKNGGSINAQLTNAALVPKKTNKYIEITSTAVSGITLDAGDTMDFIVTIKFKDVDSFEIQDDAMSTIAELQLSFIQVETSSDSTSIGGNSNTAEPKFVINNYGTILSYNYDYGTEVSIPAEINGIQVKSIAEDAFDYSNVSQVTLIDKEADTEKEAILIMDKDNKVIIEQALYEFLCNERYSETESDSTTTSTGECGGMKNLSDMGWDVYYSFEEILNEYSDYEIDFSSVHDLSYTHPTKEIEFMGNYIDVTTGMPQKSYSRITKLDLSKAIYLERIDESTFNNTGSAEDGECVNQTEGDCSLGKLENVIFPKNGTLKEILESAFKGNKLTSITIPSSVTYISESAFNINPLTSVTIEGDTTRFDSSWSNIFGTATKITQ